MDVCLLPFFTFTSCRVPPLHIPVQVSEATGLKDAAQLVQYSPSMSQELGSIPVLGRVGALPHAC